MATSLFMIRQVSSELYCYIEGERNIIQELWSDLSCLCGFIVELT